MANANDLVTARLCCRCHCNQQLSAQACCQGGGREPCHCEIAGLAPHRCALCSVADGLVHRMDCDSTQPVGTPVLHESAMCAGLTTAPLQPKVSSVSNVAVQGSKCTPKPQPGAAETRAKTPSLGEPENAFNNVTPSRGTFSPVQASLAKLGNKSPYFAGLPTPVPCGSQYPITPYECAPMLLRVALPLFM